MRIPALVRRQVVSSSVAMLLSSLRPPPAPAETGAPAAIATSFPDPNLRDRGMMNQKVLVPRDYYGVFGVVPPRVLVTVDAKQPQWNAWGSCVDNSCTYVPLKQRYDGYAKYAERIGYGMRSFVNLKKTVEQQNWEAAAAAVDTTSLKPPPARDVLLKAALLNTQLLVSPNNLREVRELSLANFYVNEVDYALDLIGAAVARQDTAAAMFAWEFGRDSWNSWMTVVNRAIVEKVGDKFELLA